MSHKPDPNKNVNLTINGIPVTVPEGTRILEAAKKANVHIPTLCEHPDLCKRALCRICVVEADGRGKLIAACANDVWEGVNIVTNNLRLLNIRKTILELILANHPQDCLSCIRNKSCELQSLSAELGVRGGNSQFENAVSRNELRTESETIVRDMDKCVKCGRCVEACQEVQTIRAINTSGRSHKFSISTPYNQSLENGTCVFCGKCASVCPVGAIYEYDQSAQVSAHLEKSALDDSAKRVVAQVSGELVSALNKEFAPAANTITTGKMITAIKRLGFYKVFDADIAAEANNKALSGELDNRIKNGGKLPMISSPSKSVARFVKNFYPDLTDHLADGIDPFSVFVADELKNYDAVTVSFVFVIAQKYREEKTDETSFALTAKELARMIKLAGIDIHSLPEEKFDSASSSIQQGGEDAGTERKEIVRGFAQARKVMEAIRKGECTAKWIEVGK